MMTTNLLRLLGIMLAVAFVLIFTPAIQATNLIENGSFETNAKDAGAWSVANAIDFNVGVGNTNIAAWMVINGTIDYAGRSPYTWHAADGDHSIDLGVMPGAGGVSQTFATSPGTPYEVRFFMSGNPSSGWSGEDQPNKTLRAQAAGKSADFAFDVSAEQNSLTDMKWKLCTFIFMANSDATTLDIFSTMNPVHIGPVIDNVSVVPVTILSPAGSYAGTNVHGEEILMTVIPLDKDNMRFAVVRDALNQNPGYQGRPTTRGEMHRLQGNEFAMTLMAHITDVDLTLQWRAVVSGSVVQTGTDTLDTNLNLALYLPVQNPFAEGSAPVMCLPGTIGTYQRIPIVPPCIPAPMPE